MLIARRIHYSTRSNFLRPGGIIAHESLFQYYPEDYTELASRVKNKKTLGFTDIRPTEQPHTVTSSFIAVKLPAIVPRASTLWANNKAALVAYAQGSIPRAELYRAISSPAAQAGSDAFLEY